MRFNRRSSVRGASVAAALCLLVATAAPLPAQGCAQCRDNLRSTPPATQHAYREAIGLLAGVSLAVCSAAAIAMRGGPR